MQDAVVQHITHRVVRQDLSSQVHHSDAASCAVNLCVSPKRTLLLRDRKVPDDIDVFAKRSTCLPKNLKTVFWADLGHIATECESTPARPMTDWIVWSMIGYFKRHSASRCCDDSPHDDPSCVCGSFEDQVRFGVIFCVGLEHDLKKKLPCGLFDCIFH